MFASKLQTIRLLNGLRAIHLERIEGYNKLLGAMNSDIALQHGKLEVLLSDCIRNAVFMSSTLENIVLIEGGKNPYGTKVNQHLYQLSRQMRELFQYMNKHSFIDTCGVCENLLQQAYDFVLNGKEKLPAEPGEIVQRQQTDLARAQAFLQSLHKKMGAVAA